MRWTKTSSGATQSAWARPLHVVAEASSTRHRHPAYLVQGRPWAARNCPPHPRAARRSSETCSMIDHGDLLAPPCAYAGASRETLHLVAQLAGFAPLWPRTQSAKLVGQFARFT